MCIYEVMDISILLALINRGIDLNIYIQSFLNYISVLC